MATRSFISPLRRFRKLANIKNQSLSSTENGEKFIWDGTLKNLKKFVAGDLKLLGKWTSPCGETIEIIDIECVLGNLAGTQIEKKIALINPPCWICPRSGLCELQWGEFNLPL